MSYRDENTVLPLPEILSPVGIGLRAAHYKDLIEDRPSLGWLEIHPENYFGGGAHRHFLKQIAKHYPLSFHCVGLSLGSAQPVCKTHLQNIKDLAEIYNPVFISDHASWSASGNAHLNDLLPLPYTRETLMHLCDNIDAAQNFLGQKILIENPSTYLMFKNNEMSEAQFMNETAQKTDCGILLDLNNIYVQSQNHGMDATVYIDEIHADKIMEYHLAGHSVQYNNEHKILIDTHNHLICDDVWNLYAYAIAKTGARATLIEWDQDLPPLQVLLDEGAKAQAIMLKKERLHDAA